MELRLMKTFMVVARELNFGRAARVINIAQPAVSQQIAQLEKDLGVVLFDRTSRSVKLTAAGAAFVGPCQVALDAADAAARAAQNSGSGDIGLVRIGFAGAFANEGVSGLARAVRRKYPELELFLAGSANSTLVLNELVADRIDVGIMSAGFLHPKIAQRLVSANPLGVLVPTDHRLATASGVDLAELRAEPFVLTDPASGFTLRDVTVAACRDAGFTPIVAQQAADSYTVFALVAAGMGVTLAPFSRQPVWSSGVVFVPLTGGTHRLLSVVAWRSDHQFPALRSVLAVAEQVLPTVAEGPPVVR